VYKGNPFDTAVTPSFFEFFEDFTRQDSIATGGAVTATLITSGTVSVRAANGGWLSLNGVDDTDNTGAQVQSLAAHVITQNKRIAFSARVQARQDADSTTVAAESDISIGLFPIDTSLEASLPVDGIYFRKAEGATAIKCVIRNNSATAVFDQTIASVMDTSVHLYGILIKPNGALPTSSGLSSVVFTIDGEIVALARNVNLPAGTIVLASSVAFQTGDATGQKFLDIDFLRTVQDR